MITACVAAVVSAFCILMEMDLLYQEWTVVAVLPFPCECLAKAVYEYHLYVAISW